MENDSMIRGFKGAWLNQTTKVRKKANQVRCNRRIDLCEKSNKFKLAEPIKHHLTCEIKARLISCVILKRGLACQMFTGGALRSSFASLCGNRDLAMLMPE